MKTCPTCGARAFDDAEVCYGCLHRYEAINGGATQVKLHGGASEDRKADSLHAAASCQPTGSTGHRASAAQGAVSASMPPEGERRQAMRPDGEPEVGRGEAWPTMPKPRACTLPEDGAGWTVRFELPGYAPVLESGENGCGFVVRFQPEAKDSLGRRNARLGHGTHARDAPADGRALASLSERSQ